MECLLIRCFENLQPQKVRCEFPAGMEGMGERQDHYILVAEG